MEIIIGLILALVGGLFYTNKRRQDAEALNNNLETKNKVIEIDKFIARNEVEVVNEKELRERLARELESEKNETNGKDDLLDFINGKSDDNK